MNKHVRRKRTPYDPSKVADRRAQELGRGAEVYFVEIEDPYEAGAKILAARSRRDDPLADMHARKQIDEAQFQGGLAFQRDFEAAERGPRAIDPGKEFVDGGSLPEPITEAQQKAAKMLKDVYEALGADGSALMHDVLIHRQRPLQISISRGFFGRKWEDHFKSEIKFRLNQLAYSYGYTNRAPRR
jgi:hypothetical protein